MAASSVKRSFWRRFRKPFLWLLGLLVGLPLAVVGAGLVFINTSKGQHIIEQQLPALTGGMVRVEGLSGWVPSHLRVQRLTLQDSKGVWFTLEKVRLDWSPSHLVWLVARINTISAERLLMPRLPVADPVAQSGSPPPAPEESHLKLGVNIKKLHIAELHLPPSLTRAPMVLAVDGRARIRSIDPFLSGITLENWPRTDLNITVKRLDKPAVVALKAQVSARAIGLHLNVEEGRDGLVGQLASMPALDPLSLKLDMHGPRKAEKLALDLKAGALTARLHGGLNLHDPHFDLALKAQSPRMQLEPGLGWDNIALEMQAHGTPSAPVFRGHALLEGLAADAAGFNRLELVAEGAAPGELSTLATHVHGQIDGLRVPGPSPGLFAGAPLVMDGLFKPALKGRPLDFSVAHKLLGLKAHIQTAPGQSGHIDLVLKELSPLAAVGRVELKGHARLKADFSLPEREEGPTELSLAGRMAFTGGMPQAVSLIGPDGTLDLKARLLRRASGSQDVELSALKLKGRGVDVDASGRLVQSHLDAKATLSLPDLSRLLPALRGRIALHATANGPYEDFSSTLAAQGSLGTKTLEPGPLKLQARLEHLPASPSGRVELTGTLDHAPLDMLVHMQQDKQGLRSIELSKLAWKSAAGSGAVRLPPGATLPLGRLSLSMERLADLKNLLGQNITGAFKADIKAAQAGAAPHIAVNIASNLATAGAHVHALSLTGHVDDPLKNLFADLLLKVDGLSVSNIKGNAQVKVRGPREALNIQTGAAFQNLFGRPARLDGVMTLNLPDKTVNLRSLSALVRDESIRLLHPAAIRFGTKMGVDHLNLSVSARASAPAMLNVSGAIRPRLGLNITAENITPALAAPFVPSLSMTGRLDGRAALTGTTEKPQGNVQLQVNGLKMKTGPAASLPAAQLLAEGVLDGRSARIRTTARAGSKINATLAGMAPLAPKGPVDLHLDGRFDLGVANAILGSNGQQLNGLINLALGVGGTLEHPLLRGQAHILNGSFQDYGQGLRLKNIHGLVIARGSEIVLQDIVAGAGKGEIGLGGRIGLLEAGVPLDITLNAHNAQPLSSDMITAVVDTDLHIKGQASARIDATGSVRLNRAEINLPQSLPPSIARLNVVRPGENAEERRKAAAQPPSHVVGLDISVVSPGNFFVRGHGLDAEMRGKLAVKGLASAPDIQGGFKMKRGDFNLGGISLHFTEGRVGFDGAGVTHKIDPSLHFVAERDVNGTTARMYVKGYASAPKIEFASNPPFPQDQVLGMLLFGVDAQSLSSTQMAEIGIALATLAGNSGGFDPMGTLRKGLGLDRLGLGSSSSSGKGKTGPDVEVGKNVMRGVYVGAKQSTSGGGTRAEVQIDLTKRLKFHTTVGTDAPTTGIVTPDNAPGTTFGLGYHFKY